MSVVAAVEEVFAHALRGEACFLSGAAPKPLRVPVEQWTREPDAADGRLLDHCAGPTLDVGCGPGRLTAELSLRGHVALGIDVVPEAVDQTVVRGGTALRRSVFDQLPGEGRWHTALVADGNIGIGGDAVALLRRIRRLLAPGGRAVIEVAGPGVAGRRLRVRLECACATSAPFWWSVLGTDDVRAVARDAGFAAVGVHDLGGRWAAVLEEAA